MNPQERAIRAAEVLQERMDGLESKLKKYGYEPTQRENTDRAEAGAALGMKAAKGNSEEGEGVSLQSGARRDATLTEKVISSPTIPYEDVEDALAAATRLIDVTSRMGSNSPPTVAELRETAAQVKITKQGIMFGDGKNAVYLMFRSGSSIKTDPYRAMAERLNSGILENNEKLKNLEKTEDAYKEGYIKPLKEKNIGSSLSKRGPMLEAATVMTVLGNTLVECEKAGGDCSDVEEKIKAQFKEMQGNGTLGEAQEIMRRGLCANADACLVNMDDYQSAVVQEQIRKYLVEDPTGPQLGEEQAQSLMRIASEYEDGGARAMAMLVASTRGYTAIYDGIVVTDATQWGGADATSKGQKDDYRLTMSEEEFATLRDRIENNPNETDLEKGLREAAECGGKGVGIDQWGTDAYSLTEAKKPKKAPPTIKTEKGDRVVGFELKAVEDKTSRIKSGEGTSKKLTTACTPPKRDEEGNKSNKLEEEFLKANSERLKNCGGDLDFGTDKDGTARTAEQAACDFQEGVNESPIVKAFSFLADGGQPEEADFTLQHTGAAMVKQWADAKKGQGSTKDQEKRTKRSKDATAGFAAMQNQGKAFSELTPEQREGITKIGLELEQAAISKRLDDYTDANGVVTGEGLGYLLTRLTQDSGSLNECAKEVRRMEEGEQRVGMINVTTYGGVSMLNQGTARMVRNKHSNTYRLETAGDDPKVIFKGSMERGQNVNEIGDDTISPVDTRQQRNAKAHQPTAEETMHLFLVGQKALLEKLIDQTT